MGESVSDGPGYGAAIAVKKMGCTGLHRLYELSHHKILKKRMANCLNDQITLLEYDTLKGLYQIEGK